MIFLSVPIFDLIMWYNEKGSRNNIYITGGKLCLIFSEKAFLTLTMTAN